MDEETRTSEPRVKVKLIKNTKGYGWEITARGDTVEETMALLDDAEQQVREKYGAAE